MKVKSFVTEIASVGLFVAFASTAALAQAGGAGPTENQSGAGVRPNVGSAPSPTTAPTGAAEKSREQSASTGPWTADNVTADRPFGSISTDAAGTTPESMRSWAQSRTESEKAELSGRCAVITSSANSSKNYPSQAQEFCRDYMMVANVPTPNNPTGVPGAASTGQSGGQLNEGAAKASP
jgi:hypothetical protein